MGFDAILSHRLDYKTALILTSRRTVKYMGNCERMSVQAQYFQLDRAIIVLADFLVARPILLLASLVAVPGTE